VEEGPPTGLFLLTPTEIAGASAAGFLFALFVIYFFLRKRKGMIRLPFLFLILSLSIFTFFLI